MITLLISTERPTCRSRASGWGGWVGWKVVKNKVEE